MPGPRSTCSAALLSCFPYGRTSQKTWSAIALAFLLSADVPGVNVPLSPELLKDAACCMALWIAVWFVPQYAASHGCELSGAAARHGAERRGVQLCRKQLLQELHPRLVER